MINFKDNNQLDLLDVLSVLSFLIGIMNLDENISQGDLQDKAQFKLYGLNCSECLHSSKEHWCHLDSFAAWLPEILNQFVT